MDTLDEVWQILKEIALSQQEERKQLELLRLAGIETDRRFKETAEQFKETDRQFKETDRQFKETDRQFKETDRQFKETDRKLKELGRQVGSIGERFGSFTEGLAYPSLRKVLLKQYGIDNTVANYLKRFPDGSEIELDAFGFTNGTLNNAVVVEVKTHLQSKHIYEFSELLKNFNKNFPEFANKHLFGVLVTARIVSKELRKEIFDNGLHLAIVHDDIFDFDRNPNAIDFNNKG